MPDRVGELEEQNETLKDEVEKLTRELERLEFRVIISIIYYLH